MTDFVDLPFTTTRSDFEDIAQAVLESKWPGWIPNEGDPEVVLTEIVSPVAENLGQQASRMPMQALIALAVKLLGQSYGSGASAYTTVRLTMQDNASYTVKQFGGIEIDGRGFVLTEDVTSVATALGTQSTVDALFASTDFTADANGLDGSVSVNPIAMPGFVTGYSVLAPTSGGADPQTDDDFANQVSRDRRLNSRAYVVGLDFELGALDVAGIGRAHADMAAGRQVNLTVLGSDGHAATAGAKAAVAALFTTGTKMVNAVVSILDPSFSTVNVTYTAYAESGFDPTDLRTRINAALVQELSPLTHGVPQSGDPGNALTTWINDPYIYVNRIIQVIGSVTGVHRVGTVSLSGSLAAHLTATLGTGAPITSLPITGLVNTLPTGPTGVVTISEAGHTQNWTLTAQANPGAATLAVASQTPNFAYTAAALFSAPVVGDFQMPGAVPVPQAGVMTGTIS